MVSPLHHIAFLMWMGHCCVTKQTYYKLKSKKFYQKLTVWINPRLLTLLRNTDTFASCYTSYKKIRAEKLLGHLILQSTINHQCHNKTEEPLNIFRWRILPQLFYSMIVLNKHVYQNKPSKCPITVHMHNLLKECSETLVFFLPCHCWVVCVPLLSLSQV